MKKTLTLLIFLASAAFSDGPTDPFPVQGIWTQSGYTGSELFLTEFQINGGSYWITNESGAAKELLSTLLMAKSMGAQVTVDWVWQYSATSNGRRKVTRISFN